MVVALHERIESSLLLKKVFGGRFGSLLLQREVHALVPTVLLGVPGFDALDANAEAEPPDRELAQVEQCPGAGEGHAVIGTDGAGQAEVLERTFEDGKGVLLLRGGQGA